MNREPEQKPTGNREGKSPKAAKGVPSAVRPDPTAERRIFLAGSIFGLVYVLWLFASFFLSREHFDVYLGMTVSHVFFGRAAGMSFGYALDYGHPVVISVNLAIETVMVMLFYPLFVFSITRLLVMGVLRRFMERMRKAAEANRDKIRRYGIPGLFVFVFIPFWMTGPLVGSIIGYMIGLRPLVNLSIVLSGTYVAILAWAVLLKELRDHLASVSALAPFLLVLIVVAIVVAGRLLERADRRKGDQR